MEAPRTADTEGATVDLAKCRDALARLSEELRTPLTSVLGYSEALLDEVHPVNDPELHRMVGIIYANAERLRSALDTLAGALNTGDPITTLLDADHPPPA